MGDESVPALRLTMHLLVGALVGLLGGAIAVAAVVMATPSSSTANDVAESVAQALPDLPVIPPDVRVVLVPPDKVETPIPGRPPRLVVVTNGRSLSQALDALPPSGIVATASRNGWWVAASVDESATDLMPALLAGLVALLTGTAAALAGAWWLKRPPDRGDRWSGDAGTAGQAPTHKPAPGPTAVPEWTFAAVERSRNQAGRLAALVRGLADLQTQLPEEYAWLVDKTLRDGGAEPFRAEGESFDPALHHSVGTTPAVDDRQINTVARTIRLGYRDDRDVLVAPRVVVYAAAQARGGETQ